MKCEIKEIKGGEIWNDFIKNEKHLNILSSWEWIEFERKVGFKNEAYSIGDRGIFSFRVVNAKKGKYLILKQNVFLDWEDEDAVFSLISFLKLKCEERGCKFFRISPPLLNNSKYEKLFKGYGFQKSVVHHTDAQLTVVLDLQKSQDDILKDMRKNTRYLVRKGEKFSVEVLHTDSNEYFGEFERVYEKTLKRHKWNAIDLDYISKQYELFSSHNLSRMFVAKYKGEILAAAIFTKFQSQVIYHHSGSVLTDIPAMYSLIWEAIKYYKNEDLGEFNFFGVCKKDDVKHPWFGLSLFKRGFGGNERELMHSYDYPVSRSYYLIRSIESLINS